MTIENTCYVLMKIGNIEINDETVFLGDDDTFTNDIKAAVKAANRITALTIKNGYEINKNHCYESDLKIVPLKVTYEW